ncbi:hypothetical protein TIFTF001_018875 [Ficus carica]|uniref:Uncharacterized protein n=1 Tax=Ficus carica TaxID=3494 RepID=A0AA88AVZ9_FICCA|nr:hypothetical protein TIFTF001_018875 [Ficus carica]
MAFEDGREPHDSVPVRSYENSIANYVLSKLYFLMQQRLLFTANLLIFGSIELKKYYTMPMTCWESFTEKLCKAA